MFMIILFLLKAIFNSVYSCKSAGGYVHLNAGSVEVGGSQPSGDGSSRTL